MPTHDRVQRIATLFTHIAEQAGQRGHDALFLVLARGVVEFLDMQPGDPYPRFVSTLRALAESPSFWTGTDD